MDKRIARGSVEPIGVVIEATTPSGAPVDPTAFPVRLAVQLYGVETPADGVFKTAAWSTGPAGYVAFLDVGTGTDVGALAPGNYRVWAKVDTDGLAEALVRSSDRLIVY